MITATSPRGVWVNQHKYTVLCRLKYHQDDDVVKWKHFPRYWPFVRGTHRSPVNSPHKGQWRRALMFSLICALVNDWVNNGEAGDLRSHRTHYDVIVWVNNSEAGDLRSHRTHYDVIVVKFIFFPSQTLNFKITLWPFSRAVHRSPKHR